MTDYAVANVMGRVVTRGELKAAFDQVANDANWKLPVNAIVVADEFELAMIKEAVVFFTGSVAKFKPLAGGRFRVTASGYYRAVGA